ncbi:gliding motility-associated C-terminal domain-containing protein [Flavobacterium sp. ENC]|uniref:gliding motility-associated C-terminal domain-containing protein n=1 Tax=Flavobacterium sp. ENC TaxID=2897330 RepID=UPI001E3E925C|nr:gliding motility-associated C-terminal domain-containing protein [Flavobacterium sp. ENC]MCD0467186.1 gliding motility-associated C-terminal domain-containing protein [Flavobacterium sp. ENC]
MKKVKTLFFWTICPIIASAQTYNEGTLVISPQTEISTVGVFTNALNGTVLNDGTLYVYDHFNNEGLVTFTPNSTTGITVLKGSKGIQNIGGTSPMDWNHVQFDNSSVQPAFQLSNEVTVFGQVDFLKGILNSNAGQIIFENTATAIHASDESHIDGTVKKIGASSFEYPIGNSGYYRYAALSAPDVITDSFTSQYFFENPGILYPGTKKESTIELVDHAEYWQIERTNGDSNVLLTLSWNEATTPPAIIATPYEDIHIVRWDPVSEQWTDVGGVADFSSKEVTTLMKPVTSYGIFTLARVKASNTTVLNCAGVPVEIMNLMSPNNDGLNDYFKILGLNLCPNNKLEIYNRWGVKVFETRSYDTKGNIFEGFSDARLTINKEKLLPPGTYFYVLTFRDENSAMKQKDKIGYLFMTY